MLTFKTYLSEGVNDPAIFKAVFLAGGPGSGKSFIVGQTALQALGMKLINSDPAFEAALEKAGLKTTPEDIASERGQAARGRAKILTKKQMNLAVNGRLGLIIDGTGKDADKLKKQSTQLKKLGYETAMIFVNTNLETALDRNRKRARSLPDEMVKKMWKGVQDNIGAFQTTFGENLFIIDNSDGADFKPQVQSVYKKISAWSKKEPYMPQAKAWITGQKSKK